MKRLTLLILCLGCLPLTAQNPADSVITVGIKHAPPFVELRQGASPAGLSIDFWHQVENDAKVLYRFREFEDLSSLLRALQAGEIDMSVNPVTVTEERMQHLDFSQPYYISGTTMVRQNTSSWMAFFRNFFTWQFFSALAILLAVIFIFGLLMWLSERKRNHEMFEPGMKGLGAGFWWSAVTMTTVGYGDKAPVTPTGRIIGFIWMFAAMLLISGLTASIASSLTVSTLDSKIESAEDLRRFSVGTIGNTSTAGYLELFGVNYNSYTSVESGLQAVADGELEVFVYDRPLLRYFLNQMPKQELILSNKDFKTDYYSFSYPQGSSLRNYLDPFLVKALRSERWNYRLQNEHTNN